MNQNLIAFYGVAAQVIPLLFLAMAFSLRRFVAVGDHFPTVELTRRAVLPWVFLTVFTLGLGEACALLALGQGEADRWTLGLVSASIYFGAITLVGGVLYEAAVPLFVTPRARRICKDIFGLGTVILAFIGMVLIVMLVAYA